MEKQGFLDYKNAILTLWESVHFSKGKKPMIFVKKFEISSESHFL